MVFPYVDSNPLGNGYYTIRQRRVALWDVCDRLPAVDSADRHRDFYPWSGLDLVLAGSNLGPQCRSVTIKNIDLHD